MTSGKAACSLGGGGGRSGGVEGRGGGGGGGQWGGVGRMEGYKMERGKERRGEGRDARTWKERRVECKKRVREGWEGGGWGGGEGRRGIKR